MIIARVQSGQNPTGADTFELCWHLAAVKVAPGKAWYKSSSGRQVEQERFPFLSWKYPLGHKDYCCERQGIRVEVEVSKLRI